MDVLFIFIDVGVYLYSEVLKLKVVLCFFLQGGKIMEESDFEVIGIILVEYRKKILDLVRVLFQFISIGN